MQHQFSLGKVLIILGLTIFIVGIIVHLAERNNIQLFKLPGDIVLKRKNFTIYIPIMTSVILSIILTLVFYLINRFK